MERSADTYRAEHWTAWLFAVLAVALGVIGALEAWDQINIGTSLFDSGAGVVAGESDADHFRDGALFLIPSLISAILAWTLHRSEHHVSHPSRTGVDTATTGDSRDDLRKEDDLFNGEHVGAYVALLASVVLGVVGVLVGFDAFDSGYTFYDGMTWLVLSLMSSLLAATLHSVGHHQPVWEEEDIRRMVEDRVARTSTTGVTGSTRIGAERR
jgi:hypothetical protein